MKILFTGKPNKGSWQIRAVQMAVGLGLCIPFASEKQCREADFIVAVKRVPPEVLAVIRASGKPWAWDVVDAYPQPECSAWSHAQSVSWLHQQARAMQPSVVCWATQRMREDAGGDGVVIYHHHRPAIACNPVRERIALIGYEGSPKYLGPWLKPLQKAAQQIGAGFTDRVASLADCDVVVALRGGLADCYATRHWKSNVKLANAHGSGTVFVGQPDAGYRETMTGMEYWVNDPKDLQLTFEQLQERKKRAQVSEVFRSAAISVEACQKQWMEVAKVYA